MPPTPTPPRSLSDADVKEIVDQLETRVAERFFNDVGRGVWSLAWKAIVLAIVGVAAYGSLKGFK
jgi:hypothetical protein